MATHDAMAINGGLGLPGRPRVWTERRQRRLGRLYTHTNLHVKDIVKLLEPDPNLGRLL
jgi:hypothetical protein